MKTNNETGSVAPTNANQQITKGKGRYTVCVRYRTVKGEEMFNRKYPTESENDTHVELRTVTTGERVVFARSETL